MIRDRKGRYALGPKSQALLAEQALLVQVRQALTAFGADVSEGFASEKYAEPVQTRAAQQTRRIARGQVLLMAQLSEASKAQRPSALVFCPDCGRGSLWSGKAWFGSASQGMDGTHCQQWAPSIPCVWAGRGKVRRGRAWHGMAWPGRAWRGVAWQGMDGVHSVHSLDPLARRGWDGHGRAWRAKAGLGTVWRGVVRPGWLWPGEVWTERPLDVPSISREARRARARQGVARPGWAGSGAARRGVARLGRVWILSVLLKGETQWQQRN